MPVSLCTTFTELSDYIYDANTSLPNLHACMDMCSRNHWCLLRDKAEPWQPLTNAAMCGS